MKQVKQLSTWQNYGHAGDPGDGKTTAVLAIAAALTTGAALLEAGTAAEPMSFIFQTAEDG